eukprot:5344547-Pyramimonas_sp.AAC.1
MGGWGDVYAAADEHGVSLQLRGLSMTDRRTLQSSFRALESRAQDRPSSKTTKTLKPVKQNPTSAL